jgi:hypothetical protein
LNISLRQRSPGHARPRESLTTWQVRQHLVGLVLPWCGKRLAELCRLSHQMDRLMSRVPVTVSYWIRRE